MAFPTMADSISNGGLPATGINDDSRLQSINEHSLFLTCSVRECVMLELPPCVRRHECDLMTRSLDNVVIAIVVNPH